MNTLNQPELSGSWAAKTMDAVQDTVDVVFSISCFNVPDTPVSFLINREIGVPSCYIHLPCVSSPGDVFSMKERSPDHERAGL
jgi:hypothetical protein